MNLLRRTADALSGVFGLLCALVGLSTPSPTLDELTAEMRREQDEEFERWVEMRNGARRDAA